MDLPHIMISSHALIPGYNAVFNKHIRSGRKFMRYSKTLNFITNVSCSTGLQKPTISKLTSQTVHEGEQVRFEIVVTGSPAPTVEWVHETDKSGEEIVSKPRGSASDTEYTLPSCCRDDEGYITVNAENLAGACTKTVSLIVKQGTCTCKR